MNFYKAEEPEKTFKVLNGYNRPELIYPLFIMLWKIFDKQPREIWYSYPLAFLRYAQTLLISGDLDNVKKGVKILESIRLHYENDRETEYNYRRVILGDVHVCYIFVNAGNLEKMIYHVEQAAKYYKENGSVISLRKGLITFGLPQLIYTHYHKPGDFKESADKFGTSTKVYASYADGCGTGGDYMCRAEYALETLDLQTAELFAYKALHKAISAEQCCIAACAYFALARINMYRGGTDETVELLKRLSSEMTPDLNTTIDLILAYVYGTLGDIDKIPEWLKTDTPPSANMHYGGMGWIQIVYGKVLLLMGDFIRADVLCESFEPRFCEFSNTLGLLHNHIHRAAAKAKSENEDVGITELKKALVIGQADNILLPFAENEKYIFSILKSINKTDHNIDQQYLEQVIDCCVQYHSNNPVRKKPEISLSEREREVLSLMSDGMSRDEIAAKLIVSTSTVKRHMENIYVKLDVNNKTKAIKKAAELGVL